MQEINIKINIEEANLILEGLGLLPYARVYALIGKLQGQATRQLRQDPGSTPGPVTDELPPSKSR